MILIKEERLQKFRIHVDRIKKLWDLRQFSDSLWIVIRIAFPSISHLCHRIGVTLEESKISMEFFSFWALHRVDFWILDSTFEFYTASLYFLKDIKGKSTQEFFHTLSPIVVQQL